MQQVYFRKTTTASSAMFVAPIILSSLCTSTSKTNTTSTAIPLIPLSTSTTTLRRCRPTTTHVITSSQFPSDDPNNRSSKLTDETYTFKQPVRLPRHHTHHDADWQWTGSSSSSSSSFSTSTLNNIYTFQKSMHKMLQVLDKKTAPLLTRITAIGVRMLRRVTHVINRAFDADYPVDLTIEYGIADPCPDDKYFVDPLCDWQISTERNDAVAYTDSFGNLVYLSLHGPTSSSAVIATDYRDSFDDDGNSEQPEDDSTSNQNSDSGL